MISIYIQSVGQCIGGEKLEKELSSLKIGECLDEVEDT